MRAAAAAVAIRMNRNIREAINNNAQKIECSRRFPPPEA
jgi:hypothetical protein